MAIPEQMHTIADRLQTGFLDYSFMFAFLHNVTVCYTFFEAFSAWFFSFFMQKLDYLVRTTPIFHFF